MDTNIEQVQEPDNKNRPMKDPGNQNKRMLFIGMLVGILVMSILFSVLFLILNRQNVKREEAREQMNEVYDLVYLEKGGPITTDVLKKLQNVIDLIHNKYSLEEVSEEVLIDGMFEGILDSLGDPYSEYFTVQELQELMSNTAGIYYGIGAYVSIDEASNMTKVSGVIEGTPAEEAKLRANDIIYKVDGVSTYGISLNDAVKMIKGEEGSTVMLTIIRDGVTLEVPVVRRKVESPTVNTEMYENGIGYLQITEFDDVTPSQFKTGLSKLFEQDMKGLILDLRGNPGGTLDGVVNIAGQILPKGIVVYTEDKQHKRVDYESAGKTELTIPLVVLVDMNTASAAEILSGAIQDYKKGTLIGTTTYGKGIVQSVMQLPDSSAVKLTVSSYFTPSGRNIHKLGITPDIVCEFDSNAYYNSENPVDNQLEKAKEVLWKMMK